MLEFLEQLKVWEIKKETLYKLKSTSYSMAKKKENGKCVSSERIREIMEDNKNYTKESEESIKKTKEDVSKLINDIFEIHKKMMLLL